ncbi:MAG TPA: ScpA family protein [Gammaproteobacteria bacterium]|nr:ScpA family protein [Gammaproteobacteria bacterium]
MPKDLYIPPDAMEVFLEAFEGPLDLLLYLIKKQNLDILDIPIAEVTRQYMEYVDFIKAFSLELAAEYLVMAALLTEIKSRMLLPRIEEDNEEEDPRKELVRRLQIYEQFKRAAASIDEMPRQGRDIFTVVTDTSNMPVVKPLPVVHLKDLIFAFLEVMKRAELVAGHKIHREMYSVRDRMSQILIRIQEAEFVPFTSLFTPEEGRLGVVVTFLAMLELLKDKIIDYVQVAPFGPIHLQATVQNQIPETPSIKNQILR